MLIWWIAIGVFGLLWFGICWTMHRRYPEPIWDWENIDTNDLAFPPDFIWGTATAAHQVEGGNDNNNWSRWESAVDDKGQPRIHNGEVCGAAAEHWQRYPEDIALMRDALAVKSYRFSVEWSRIEPEQGRFDESAIAHYHDMIDALIAAGITPMLTLHHFTNPLWFEDLGAFEKAENIAHFVRFSKRMFEEYGSKVPRWCTINECGPYAVMGYGLGAFPPGVKSFKRMAHVLHHLMLAHLAVYDTLKAMPGGQDVEIGLVKNVFQFDPLRRYNPLHWALCRVMDGAYNESIIGFIRDGVFRIKIPTQVNLEFAHPEAKGKTDFIGLNYYANLIISLFMKPNPPYVPHIRPGQIATDMPYAIYAEGFHNAIVRLSSLNKPIIVTENGIADDKDDRRELWIRRYIYAMSKAIEDGCDVQGYHYWSLLDNFEWAEGYQMRFGLIEVNYDTQARRLRQGAQAYVDIVNRFSSDA